jgi:hypothetical protein
LEGARGSQDSLCARPIEIRDGQEVSQALVAHGFPGGVEGAETGWTMARIPSTPSTTSMRSVCATSTVLTM